jgi:ribonuclease HII
MVIAGVSIGEERLEALKELGVKDSKLLSPRRRESLYPEILKVCDSVKTVKIGPREIDAVVRAGRKYKRLNYLEAQYMAKVINKLGASEVIVDAPDTVPERFRANVAENLSRKCKIFAAHFADRDFPVVSAASIVAKVQRDAAVEVLREAHGDFGSGYPSDPKTRRFFIEWLRSKEELPSFVRKSWKTWDRLQQEMLAPF